MNNMHSILIYVALTILQMVLLGTWIRRKDKQNRVERTALATLVSKLQGKE